MTTSQDRMLESEGIFKSRIVAIMEWYRAVKIKAHVRYFIQLLFLQNVIYPQSPANYLVDWNPYKTFFLEAFAKIF